MNSVEALQKKQWYEDPNLFAFAMQSEQARRDETYRKDALAQQKDIAQQQMDLEKRKLDVTSGIQGLTAKVGMWQAETTSAKHLQDFLSQNPVLSTPANKVRDLPAVEQEKYWKLKPQYDNIKEFHDGLVHKKAIMEWSFNELLGLNKPVDHTSQLKFRPLE